MNMFSLALMFQLFHAAASNDGVSMQIQFPDGTENTELNNLKKVMNQPGLGVTTQDCASPGKSACVNFGNMDNFQQLFSGHMKSGIFQQWISSFTQMAGSNGFLSQVFSGTSGGQNDIISKLMSMKKASCNLLVGCGSGSCDQALTKITRIFGISQHDLTRYGINPTKNAAGKYEVNVPDATLKTLVQNRVGATSSGTISSVTKTFDNCASEEDIKSPCENHSCVKLKNGTSLLCNQYETLANVEQSTDVGDNAITSESKRDAEGNEESGGGNLLWIVLGVFAVGLLIGFILFVVHVARKKSEPSQANMAGSTAPAVKASAQNSNRYIGGRVRCSRSKASKLSASTSATREGSLSRSKKMTQSTMDMGSSRTVGHHLSRTQNKNASHPRSGDGKQKKKSFSKWM